MHIFFLVLPSISTTVEKEFRKNPSKSQQAKNSSKFVCIPAKKCRSPFNLTKFWSKKQNYKFANFSFFKSCWYTLKCKVKWISYLASDQSVMALTISGFSRAKTVSTTIRVTFLQIKTSVNASVTISRLNISFALTFCSLLHHIRKKRKEKEKFQYFFSAPSFIKILHEFDSFT